MVRYTIELDDLNDEEKKHTGGFKLDKLDEARDELRATLMKLSGRYVSPRDDGETLEDARLKLNAVMAGENTLIEKEPTASEMREDELEKMKLNSSPKSEAEARAMLRKTQAFLAQQSQPGAKKAKPK